MKRLRWFRNSWRVRETEDARPYFEASVIFQADDIDEADRLMDAMLDAIGCAEDETRGPDEPCPHFRVGGPGNEQADKGSYPGPYSRIAAWGQMFNDLAVAALDELVAERDVAISDPALPPNRRSSLPPSVQREKAWGDVYAADAEAERE